MRLVLQPVLDGGRGSLTSTRPAHAPARLREWGRPQLRKSYTDLHKVIISLKRLRQKLRLQEEPSNLRGKERKVAKPGVVAEFSSFNKHLLSVYYVLSIMLGEEATNVNHEPGATVMILKPQDLII